MARLEGSKFDHQEDRLDLDLKVEHRATAELRPDPRNPRTHTAKQVQQIAESIRRFGFTNPILIDAEGTVIAGHGRLAAAKLLGYQTVPVLRLDHMSEAEKRAYLIADNRLAELAGWDREILAIELQALLHLDFEIELTGFEMAEIDIILDAEAGEDSGPEDEIPEPSEPISRPGDLWCLGDHRLFCGDALDASSYCALMGEERAQMAFTDPPYNIPIQGHVSGLGRVRHREFAMGCGEMNEEEFTSFLSTAMQRLLSSSSQGALLYLCMDRRHLFELLSAAKALGLATVDLCIWDKQTGGMGSFYRSRHEEIFVFKSGKEPHRNNIQLGRHGRNRTNLWFYPGLAGFGRGRDEALAAHPTVKPVALVADAIRDCTRRGDIVLDSFAGSGTTVIAAEKTGRRARAIELDPVYVDVAVRRWEALTGKAARCAVTQRSFAEIAQERQALAHEEASHVA
jgi:DNA modification methylase